VQAGDALLKVAPALVQTLQAFETFGFAPSRPASMRATRCAIAPSSCSDGTAGTAHGTAKPGPAGAYCARHEHRHQLRSERAPGLLSDAAPAVLLLVLANARYFAWSQGCWRDWGFAPAQQSEPQRSCSRSSRSAASAGRRGGQAARNRRAGKAAGVPAGRPH
jgi:hypothetical protein